MTKDDEHGMSFSIGSVETALPWTLSGMIALKSYNKKESNSVNPNNERSELLDEFTHL
jgi:hypothetical protein